MKFKVPYIDLEQQYKKIESEINEELKKVFSSGSFILRESAC